MPLGLALARALRSRRGAFFLLALVLAIPARRGAAQQPDTLTSPAALKQLSLEQLMNVQVTSVSRRPEKLSSTASAIQVITGEDIRRSGASNLPEALRLATNLQVAQVNASQWAISARGFNNVLADKLLVMIDGRTVYTPLYAGVFWDVQNPPLGDIDRIEVVSGPGGALWGANAVNGVINIITKHSKDTQGLAVEGGGGTEAKTFGTVRYGGRLSPDFTYRVYGEGFWRGSTVQLDGTDPHDSWHMGQGGLRMDWKPGRADVFSFQGDYYDGRPDPDGNAPVIANGVNGLGRWIHTLSPGSDLQVQLYYDHTWRDFGNGFTEALSTYDFDGQHRFQLDRRQEVIWGLGVRLMAHQTQNLGLFAFLPSYRLLHLYSGFVQDEITLVPNRWRLALGSKFEHNDYTGFEIQPSARLAWTPLPEHTVWAGVSRAVRTPSRIDRDFFLFAAPGLPIVAGDDFQSETVVAYELGWRVQARSNLALSLSTFYNQYDDLRSAEPGPPPSGIPITFENGVQGHSYGAELAASYQVSSHWRLRGGYTFLKENLSLKPGSADLNGGTAESDDPDHQFLVQSIADLPGAIELDAVFRYVGSLPGPVVPDYATLDLRVGWRLTPHLELSVVGQNLLQSEHPELAPSSPSPRKVQRGVYAKVTWH
jgi:iron complex outermembrane receptor protein